VTVLINVSLIRWLFEDVLLSLVDQCSRKSVHVCNLNRYSLYIYNRVSDHFWQRQQSLLWAGSRTAHVKFTPSKLLYNFYSIFTLQMWPRAAGWISLLYSISKRRSVAWWIGAFTLSIRTTWFNSNIPHILPTQYACVFCLIRTVNSD
jgi:hypothetical protein